MVILILKIYKKDAAQRGRTSIAFFADPNRNVSSILPEKTTKSKTTGS